MNVDTQTVESSKTSENVETSKSDENVKEEVVSVIAEADDQKSTDEIVADLFSQVQKQSSSFLYSQDLNNSLLYNGIIPIFMVLVRDGLDVW